MADWLLLRLPRDRQAQASWILADARGNALSAPQSGPLEQAAQRATGRHVCVLVPGEDVLLAEPELPVKAGAKLQQIVPYALEEQLAEDIDDLHFAIGKRAASSAVTPVAVVALSLMDEWTSTLKAAGLAPESMYVDSDLLPHNPGHAVALLEDDIVTVRAPVGATFSMPADALTEALQLVRPAAEPSEGTTGRGLILYTGAAEWQEHSPNVESIRDQFDGIKVQLLTSGPLSLLSQQLPTAKPINLLQGRYAPQSTHTVGWRHGASPPCCWRGSSLHVAGKGPSLHAQRAEKRWMLHRAGLRPPCPVSRTPPTPAPHGDKLATVRSGGARLLTALALGGSTRLARHPAGHEFRDGALELKMAARCRQPDRVSQVLRPNGWQADSPPATLRATP
jgi:hypothetical protein